MPVNVLFCHVMKKLWTFLLRLWPSRLVSGYLALRRGFRYLLLTLLLAVSSVVADVAAVNIYGKEPTLAVVSLLTEMFTEPETAVPVPAESLEDEHIAALRIAIAVALSNERTGNSTFSYFTGHGEKEFQKRSSFWQASSRPRPGMSFECRVEKAFGENRLGVRFRYDLPKDNKRFWPTKTLMVTAPNLPDTPSVVAVAIVIDGVVTRTQAWVNEGTAYIPMFSELERKFKHGMQMTVRLGPESFYDVPSAETIAEELELNFDLTGSNRAIRVAAACKWTPMLDSLFYTVASN